MDVFEGDSKECRKQLTKVGGNKLKFYEVGLALQALFQPFCEPAFLAPGWRIADHWYTHGIF